MLSNNLKKDFKYYAQSSISSLSSDSEKTAIDRRIEELKEKKQQILREMSAHACEAMVSNFLVIHKILICCRYKMIRCNFLKIS